MYRRHIMPTGYMYRIHSYRYKQFILAAEYTLHTPARGHSAECEDTPPSQHRLIHAQPADVMAGTDGSPGQLSSAHTPLVLLLLIITISLLSQALSC